MIRLKGLSGPFFFCLALAAAGGALAQKERSYSPHIELPKPGFEVVYGADRLDRPVRKHNNREYSGPIFDVLIHPRFRVTGEVLKNFQRDLWKMIQDQNITHGFISPTPNSGRRRSKAHDAILYRKMEAISGGRLRRFCGADYITFWMHRAHETKYNERALRRILDRVENDLDDGCVGIGEVATHHFKKHPRQSRLHVPAAFEPFLKVIDIVARKKAWLFLHSEPIDPELGTSYEDEVFGGLEAIYQRHPNLKIILSHTGMTRAINARRMLKRYPNLYMNVKARRKNNWAKLGKIVDEKVNLYQDWAKLFEDMPTRFFVGIDAKPGRKRFPIAKYAKRVRHMRRLLSVLDSKTAKMIAFENARKHFLK